jgi:hypothetical protein
LLLMSSMSTSIPPSSFSTIISLISPSSLASFGGSNVHPLFILVLFPLFCLVGVNKVLHKIIDTLSLPISMVFCRPFASPFVFKINDLFLPLTNLSKENTYRAFLVHFINAFLVLCEINMHINVKGQTWTRDNTKSIQECNNIVVGDRKQNK